MVVVMLMLAGALVDSLHSARRIETEYRSHISADISRQVTFDKLYAQGLQMGQALRNVMLDPTTPRPSATTPKPPRTSRSSSPRRGTRTAVSTRACPSASTPCAASSGKSTSSSSPSSSPASSTPPGPLLNKDETPKWREIRDPARRDQAPRRAVAPGCWKSSPPVRRRRPAQHRAGPRGDDPRHPDRGAMLSRIAHQASRAQAIIAAVAHGRLTETIHPGGGTSSRRSSPTWRCSATASTRAISLIQQSAGASPNTANAWAAPAPPVEAAQSQSENIVAMSATVEEPR